MLLPTLFSFKLAKDATKNVNEREDLPFIAVDRKGGNVRIITAYRPTLERWKERLREERMDDRLRMRIALQQMIEREASYFEEYEKWSALAARMGMKEASKLILEAKEHVVRANAMLERTIDLIR